MKKFLAVILLLVYFTVSTGFVVCMHYCMDRFDSAQLGSSENEKCHKCGMHKDGGCCRDEVKVVKLQIAHLASQIDTFDFPLAVRNFTSPSFLLPSFIHYTETEKSLANGPPLVEEGGYLQNCVFRI